MRDGSYTGYFISDSNVIRGPKRSGENWIDNGAVMGRGLKDIWNIYGSKIHRNSNLCEDFWLEDNQFYSTDGTWPMWS